MYWENPRILLGLWILPLVAWALVRAHRKRASAARAFVDGVMVPRLMPSLGGPRRWVKGVLLLSGLALLIVAGARPRFGVYTETVAQRGVDLFVLLDVSRSMTAEDVAPSRLERAKSDIRDLLPHLARDRVGLIVFAGKPVVKVPLTNDQGFFRMVLDEVDVGNAPRGGTLIGDAVRKALEAMPRSRDRDQVLVLITDGEDQDSYAEDAAKAAAERGVRVFTVGLGDSREGARIPLHDASGRLTYLQYEGQERWSKLNDRLLKQIALTTGGAYIPAGTRAYDLGQVYVDHLAGLTRSEYQAEKRKRYRERFQWFVFLGVAMLLAEMGIAGYRPDRHGAESNAGLPPEIGRPTRGGSHQREVGSGRSLAGGGDSTPRQTSAAIVLGSLLLASVFPSVAAAGSGEAAQKVRTGIAEYRLGNYKQAVASFTEADVAKPDDLRIAFDRGVAMAAQGNDKAAELLQKAAMSSEVEVAARARYNLGCLAAAKARKLLGEHPETASPEVRKQGLTDLAVAVDHFRECLRLEKEYDDARHNLELIRLWTKAMQSLWEQNDRRKQREEMDLAAFVQMLEEQQQGLRSTVRGLVDVNDSPKRRDAQRRAEMAQRKLGEEIEPLKRKIEDSLSKTASPAPAAPGAATSAPTPVPDQMKQAIAHLQFLADNAGRAIEFAVGNLHAGQLAEAVKRQTAAVEAFNQLYRSVVQYPNLVGRALASQQGLLSDDAKKREGADRPQNALEAAWNQDFVTRYSEVLVPIAKEGLKQLQSATTVPLAGPATAAKGGPAANSQQNGKQLEGMQQSMKKAVELGPKVEKLSDEAAQLLRNRKPADALSRQQEALKLLKEIAAPLPKQNPPQQKQQTPNKQDQSKQDQNEQKQKDQGEKQQNQQNPEQQQKDAAQQHAEAAIRQVQERQQQRQEMGKQLQRYQTRPGNVEKDW